MSRGFSKIGKELSARRVLVDGGLMSAILSSIVLGSLAYDAEMWHGDYPPDIQKRAGPMSERAKREQRIVAVPLLTILFGAPFLSNMRLKRERGGKISFPTAAINAYLVWQVFNLFDLLVLDYLILMVTRPRFSILPGTEGMESYSDWRVPLVGFIRGLGIGLLPSLVIGFVSSRERK